MLSTSHDLRSLQTIRNAIENASQVPITDEGIRAILTGGSGHASHRRALFSDVSVSTLFRYLSATNISRQSMLFAYQAARDEVCAANAELDDLLRDEMPMQTQD